MILLWQPFNIRPVMTITIEFLALHGSHALDLFLRVLQLHRQPLSPPLEPLQPPRLELVAADEPGAEDKCEQEHSPVESRIVCHGVCAQFTVVPSDNVMNTFMPFDV